MSNDEQTIYISPEDDLTNVRERLESLSSRSITLVIPKQTMLRSHVAWRNLYARARELEKDILIISEDAQIRSLAQAAKFRVAHSLESSPTGKSRLGMNRPVRSNPTSRMRSTQLRPSNARNTTTESSTPQRSNRSGTLDPSTRSPSRTTHASNNPSTYQGPESVMPLSNELATGGLHNPEATYDLPDNSYGPTYDFKIGPSPFQPQPLPPEHLEEDPDLLDEDYQKTLDIHQSIVESQQQSDTAPTSPQASMPATPMPREQEKPTYRITPLPAHEDDAFSYMEDALPPFPRTEQHGGVSLESDDTAEQSIQDISEMPTDVMHNDIEYQGDLGDFVHPENGPDFVRNWMDSLPEDEQDLDGPAGTSRAYGVRPRTSRSGKPAQPSANRRNSGKITPIEDRPTQAPIPAPGPSQKQSTTGARFNPPEEAQRAAPETPIIPLSPIRGARPSQKLPSQGNTPPAPAQTPAARPPRQPVQRAGASRVGTNRRGDIHDALAPTPTTARSPRSPRQPQRKQGLRGGTVFVAIILLFFILLGLIGFVYPTADVTITVASRDFSAPVTLLASTQSATKPGSVPATTVTQTFPLTGGALTGAGTATGSTNIARATGTVTFTNNGSAPVDIPTGTTIQTPQGIQFVTTADGLANTANSVAGNSIPINAQAKQQGESGNVPAGSITVIPQSGLTTIAAQPGNPPLSSIKLTVTNDNAFALTGSGVAATVLQSDIDKVKKPLRDKMQNDITAWEKQQTQQGDIAGTPTITELIDGPKVGQIVDTGSFPLSLKLTVTMLIVRNAAIQKAAIASLDDTLSKSKQANNANYRVASDANHPVAIQNPKITQTANTLTLNFTGKGQIVPNIAPSQAQQLIIGKSKQEAKNAITQSIQNVQNVDIQTNPGFYPLIPYIPAHVTIHLVPGTPK